MRIGIVGGGIAGPVAALLLVRDGHDVRVLERVADPRPVGAGFVLQPFGQDILAELGVLAPIVARSMPVRRIDGRTVRGRVVLDFAYLVLANGTRRIETLAATLATIETLSKPASSASRQLRRNF